MSMLPPSSSPSGLNAQPLSLWVKLAAAYLFIPLVPFIAGWLKPWIALPLLACITASGFMILRSSEWTAFKQPSPRDIRYAAIIGSCALAFACITGLSSWLPQSSDQLKHNLILGDLIERPWPTRYTTPAGERFLCYGLGYYMIPAAFAKLFGTHTVSAASFVWSTFGLALFFHWVGLRFTKRPVLGIAVSLLCCGSGACWFLLKSGFVASLLSFHQPATAIGDRLMELGLYTSNLDSLTRIFYQPQHGIAAWIGSALIYELVVLRARWTEAAAILSATLFWSPITSVGLAVMGIAAVITRPETLKLSPAVHLLTALLVTGVMLAFYLPHVPILERDLIWNIGEGSDWWRWYALFLAIFVLIPVSPVIWFESKHPYLGEMKPVWCAMVILLVVSPLFKLGQFGDLRMQISGPAWVFLAVAMAKGLVDSPTPISSPRYIYLAAVFLAGAIFPVFRSAVTIARGAPTDYRIETLRENHQSSILDLTMPGFDVTAQYLGDAGAASAKWLLKPLP